MDATNVTSAFAAMRQAQIGGMLRQFGIQSQEPISKGEGNELDIDDMTDPDYAEKAGDAEEETQEQEETQKEDNDDDDAEKGKQNDIEKSDIMEAIAYSGNIKVKKTGKEIKEQLNSVVIPAKIAVLEAKKAEANECLKDCGDAPTHDCDHWRCSQFHIEVPFKFYNWDEMRTKNCDQRVVDSLSYEHQEGVKPDFNCPKTKDEACARECYMEAVRAVCEIMVDLKACDLLVKNLQDNASIELTPQQVIAFQFD